jgi:hypothetical protein
VHESETTELASSLEPADWRVPSGNYLEDLSQTQEIRIFGNSPYNILC